MIWVSFKCQTLKMIGRIHNKAHCTKLNLHVRKKVRNWKIVKTKVNRWYLVVTHWGSAGHRGSLLAGRRKERIVTYSNTSLQTGKRSNDLADIYYLLVENCLHCLFRIEPRLRGDWGETWCIASQPRILFFTETTWRMCTKVGRFPTYLFPYVVFLKGYNVPYG